MGEGLIPFYLMKAPMLKNNRSDKAYCGSYNGCSCHNSSTVRKAGKKAVRQAEKKAWKNERV